MGKVMTAVAVTALFAITAPLAPAQAGAPLLHPQVRQLMAVAFILKNGQLATSKLIGSSVYDVQNRNIGSVKDVLLDRSGKVDTVVLDVGSFLGVGGKYVGVALSDLKMDNDRLTLDRSKEELKAAASFPYEQADNTTNR